MPRWGHFRYPYDPDAEIPSLRPYQLEGEAKPGRKAVSIRGAKPPERPDIDKRDPNLYSDAFLKKPPHETVVRDDERNARIYKLNKEQAEAWGLKTGAGYYVRYELRIKVQGGHAWVQRWAQVPPQYVPLLSQGINTAAYANDPRRLLGLARFLARWGLSEGGESWMKDMYWATWKFIKARTREIRRDQQEAYSQWRNETLKSFNDSLRKAWPNEYLK